MRGADITQAALFSSRTLEARIPQDHPLGKLRAGVEGLRSALHGDFEALYASAGRPSRAPERLWRASLIQALSSMRWERQLLSDIEYHLLYRWWVGLDREEAVWDHATFTKNRARLLNEAVVRAFFAKGLDLAEWQGLISSEPCTGDGTLIEAWASLKSFVPKDGSSKPAQEGGRTPPGDLKGEKRRNDTPGSSTDPAARLYQKAEGEKARLGYLGHALRGNRTGLVGDVETTRASGTAQREAAQTLVERSVKPGATRGTDKGYDTAEFVQAMRA